MDRVKGTALFKKVESDCGMDMDIHMEGCCDDEWALKIVEDEQQVVYGSDTPTGVYHLLYEVPFNELLPSETFQEAEVEVNNTGPPDVHEPDLFILYSSLKIPFALQS